ncbi:MAG: TetR/AcrR family transcriptional regulator [Cyclobacteriaceae bacterium]|nr:TetR/AcrR family transcriptional regulator [Cyclobacteriaceae bacterium]
MEELETREKILEGVEALFMKYGVRSVTMDDIARHLAISKKTLYQHFADKDDLVYKMSESFLERTFRQYEAIARDSKNSIEELSKISVCMKHDMEHLNPSMLFDLQKYHPKAWNLWIDHKTKVITESVIRNIRQGVDDGYFRPEINPEVMAITRLILIENAFDARMFPRDKFNFADVQSQLFEFFVHGLCTDKGKKLYQKYKESSYQPSIL